MDWRPIETAPRDGTPILLAYDLEGYGVHGYVPWRAVSVVIGWWEGASYDPSWKMCFMEDEAADSYGFSRQFFMPIPEAEISGWMPLPEPPTLPSPGDTGSHL